MGAFSRCLWIVGPMNAADRHGFTTWDLVVVMGTVGLLVFLLLPTLGTRHLKPRNLNCVSNLRQIGLAFHVWSSDHGEKFPMALPGLTTNGGTMEFNLTGQVWRHFQILSHELPNPRVLACVNDDRQGASSRKDIHDNRNLSYFVGLDADETRPKTILSGDRNLTSVLPKTRGVLALGAGDQIEWSEALHHHAGNISLADGSVHQVTDHCLNKKLQSAVSSSGQTTHRLALPE